MSEWKEGWSATWASLPKPGRESPKEIKLNPYSGNPQFLQINDNTVTPEDVEQFQKKGYWMAPKLLEDEDIQRFLCTVGIYFRRLRQEVQRVMHGEVDNDSSPYEYHYWFSVVEATHKGSKAVKKINNSWWINETIRSVVKSKVVRRCPVLFGRKLEKLQLGCLV